MRAEQPDLHGDGLGIVYFGNDWNAENRTSSHHIARRLAARTTLLYVDSPGMRAPTTSGRDLKRLWRKLGQTFQRARHVDPGLWHCTVPQLPWRRLPGVAALNRWFGAWAVRRAMRAAGIRRAILWFVVPHPAFMIDVLDHELSVYYCIDDYAAHPGVDVQLIQSCDTKLTREADRVFVAPPALVAGKQAINPSTSFSPHGVDVALFARAQDEGTAIPQAAAGLPRPVIGYFGLIAAWTDTELVEWLALQRPQWTFLLVGHAKVDVDALDRLPNVVLAGAQPYESLPGWARAFDVAIIPYRQNRQVQNANPLKLREYLATGKPVVSVPTPEIDRFAEVVRLAPDRQGFLAAIEAALQDDSAAQRDARMASVREMSWDHRVDETLAIVGQALHESAVRHA
jgi:glycosyltransferase involved in cell wall biosynthesis